VHYSILTHVAACFQHLVHNFFCLQRVETERVRLNFIQECSVEVLKYKKNSILVVFEDLYKLNDMIIRFKLV